MKKIFTLGIIIVLSLLFVTGCSNYSIEEIELEATVVKCEQGRLHPDSSYSSLANNYLSQGNYSYYSMYNSLARQNGSYDYNITISIEGENHVVVRSTPYEAGDTITVTKKITNDQNGDLVKIEYT